MHRIFTMLTALSLAACEISIDETNETIGGAVVDTGDAVGAEDCTDPVVVYYDGDGDGYGDAALAVSTCGEVAGHVPQAGDCDDISADVHPDAEEICNEQDDNCDGQVDEGEIAPQWYVDADGDGFGRAEDAITACVAPDGFVGQDGDCADDDPLIHPNALDDTCDGVDNDCDDGVDEDGVGTVWYADADGDGHGVEATAVWACLAPEGHVVVMGDCDDTDAAIHPDAADDTCDGVNNDCDEALDEDATGSAWYFDGDGDGHGIDSIGMWACLAPEGHVAVMGDCDDTDAAIHPDAADDTCDGVDNDCDVEVDEGAVGSLWYADADGDGHGAESTAVWACLAPEGHVSVMGDCDDGSLEIYPEAVDDTCNGIDNDCDGEVDEDAVESAWYPDADGDGHGAIAATVWACAVPDDHVATTGDCDDADPDIHPDALDDTCDGVDNNCNDAVDEDATGTVWFADADADEFGREDAPMMACSRPEGHVLAVGDCDDADPEIYPGATDATCDGVDNDCDDLVDEDGAGTPWYVDADDDGFGRDSEPVFACAMPSGHSASNEDCDDTDPTVHPDAPDDTCDEVDNNCDGSLDEDSTITTWYIDRDDDGHGDSAISIEDCVAPDGHVASNRDCDDTDSTIHPDAPDDTCDEVDNNCDGSLDEDAVGTPWYQDTDDDGYGNPLVSVNRCDAPTGYVATGDDCDDTNRSIHPSIPTDPCDEIDNDCDDEVDEDAPVASWYPDEDLDYYGSSVGAISVCGTPDGYVTSAGDCQDDDPSVHPWASETHCNGIDNDCDDLVDEDAPTEVWFADMDGDGHGNPSVYAVSCSRPDGYVTDAYDCDDTDADIHLGRVEVLDGKDNDCSTIIDDLLVDHADTRVDGPTPGVGFGYALAAGHDVTDDGFPDLVVGTESGDTVAIFSGDLGGGVLNLSDAVSLLVGSDSADGFGSALDVIENFDGDGKVGLVVGAPSVDLGSGAYDAGEIRVYQGPFLGGDAPVATHIFNDDGVQRLGKTVIDARYVTDQPTSAVAASITELGHDAVLIFDAQDTEGTAKWQSRIISNGLYDGFGESMAVIDHNGDGVDDLVVGAPMARDGRDGPALGAVYVFHGPLSGTMYSEAADASIKGHEDYASFGAAISAGDWDADGSADLLVGAPYGNDYQGEAFIVPMDATLGVGESVNDAMVAKLVGLSGEFGQSTALDGDVDGDGKSDALVGVPSHNPSGTYSGAVALFMGGVSGTLSVPDATVLGTQPGQNTGEVLGYTTDGSAAALPSGLAVGALGHDVDASGDSGGGEGAVFLIENAFSSVALAP